VVMGGSREEERKEGLEKERADGRRGNERKEMREGGVSRMGGQKKKKKKKKRRKNMMRVVEEGHESNQKQGGV